MKIKNFIIGLFTILALASCEKDCEAIYMNEQVLLVDVSDPTMYETISSTILTDYSTYAKRKGFLNIEECEKFICKVGYLSSSDRLLLKSDSIYLTKTGQSSQYKRNAINPTKIGRLIKTSLDKYSDLTTDKQITSGTSILNSVLKTVQYQSEYSQFSEILIFSDFMMNNEFCNFFKIKTIPKNDEERELLFQKTVDPNILKELELTGKLNKSVQITMVRFPNEKIKSTIIERDIISYWTYVFTKLGFQVVVTDSILNL